MTVTAPATPNPRDFSVYPVVIGETQTSPISGAMLRSAVPGAMIGVRVNLPPMGDRDTAMKWVNRLLRGMTETFHLPIDEPGLTTSADSATIGTSNGAALALSGLAAGYSIKEGKWVTVEAASGRKTAHLAAADFTASGGGGGTLAIWPSLREANVTGPLRIGSPYIEGLIIPPNETYTVDVARIYGVAFELREQQ